jgi:glycosyltransferase involved in cell wall biosynthesis
MVIGSIYTVFDGKGGVDYFFERIVKEITMRFTNIRFNIFCNRDAISGISNNHGVKCIYIKPLDNQYTKALWLEFFSKRYVNKANIDLFWVPSGANSFPGPWDVPTVTTIHDIGEYSIKKKYDFVRTLYRRNICIKLSLGRSARLIAPSKFTALDIRNKLGYKNEISVVHIAADPWLGIGLEHSEENSHPQRLKINQILLSVGRRNYHAKGIDTLLIAYRKVLSSRGDIPLLVLVGPRGKDCGKIKDFINKNRLRHAVLDLGEVSAKRLNALYAKASMVINASRFEGFGIPLVESMKRGKPVLCSDIDIFKEIALSAPVYFKCGNSADLAEKLTDIFDGKIDLQPHIDRGREISLRYSWENAAMDYQKIFTSLK